LNLSGANLPLSGSAQPAGDVPVNSGNVISAIADSASGIASPKTAAARDALFAVLTTLGYAPDTANDSMAAFAGSVGCAFAAEPLLVA
ncbi:MAG: hypothetical protein M3348_11365, partial [Acidobacteriota bacterium]|nr:hypothetical protein [Acidobacteriota bacterium]